ncbi:MAG: proline--tRNA ligase [Proteobacteria bacterium]|nr:proline--tRNA ligase [Pseudomonadota bacterium]MBU1639563.1 proline--tRNA ligase [Pseudomonadota bacterium]
MRFSQLLIPTLKEDPSEAEVISHKLLLRAGYIRKLTSGSYTYLPLGLAAIRKVEQIVREEMNLAGAQEILMPMVQPADLWQESGRWQVYGKELLRFQDRHNRDFCLGPTHEEVVTDLARMNIHSYKHLPMNLYQIQTKYRDEARPRFGLMRGREFIMKDGYSFDATDQGAELTYEKMKTAYHRIFNRCGLSFRAVDADSGSIGGSFSHEFMVLAETGEDTIVVCPSCSYAANMEKATCQMSSASDAITLKEIEKVETPGKRKVQVVCDFLNIKASELVKTLVYVVKDEVIAVLLRGDHEVEDIKLANILGISDEDMRLADDKEIFDATGTPSGYLGPIGLKIRLVADQEVASMSNFVVGANEKNFHLRNVNMNRDFTPTISGDIRKVTSRDRCLACGSELELTKGIEVGHIFKLGTKYSTALKATFLDDQGAETPFIMGCYGIGVSRVVAAAIEQHHDKDGIKFPVAIAPVKVLVLNLSPKDLEISQAAEEIYENLRKENIEVILDDRDERPGIKFNDADLIGIPFRITVGKSFSKDGTIEVRRRSDGETFTLSPADTISTVADLIKKAMA